ncbi:hypothetical protein BT63DRAFT_410147 [Microthyrium microscopicum]|uniref:DUF6604 domain-containing protein n=1 Tax=Microthyrium microscopicum TaxID=703497 RepID=A0A6A6UMT1_9PEZI|nr:hypothetical protein BT63DRAFT_410147 [Microthyrium microscopicum]
MLPEDLTGSYCRYKADTNHFTTWLVETAASCGTTLSIPVGNQLTPPHILPISQYPILAQAIAKANIPLPTSIEAAVKRAISLREQCANAFRAHSDDITSNNGHDHFIIVLKNTLEHLKPSSINTSMLQDSFRNQIYQGKPDLSVKNHKVPSMVNRFEALSVEHGDHNEQDQRENVHASIPVSQKKSHNTSTGKNPPEFSASLGEDEATEDLLQVWCLLYDLNNLRGFVKETWLGYVDGSIDAITAGVTTNAALVLGRTFMRELIAANYRCFRSWDNLSHILFTAISLYDGYDAYKPEQAGDWFNYQVLSIAERTFRHTTMLLNRCLLELDNRQDAILYDFDEARKATVATSSIEYQARSARDKWEFSWMVLFDVLQESKFGMFCDYSSGIQNKSEIELSMRDMLRTQKVSIWHAFNAQVFLDIRSTIAGCPHSPYNDLRMTVLRAKKNIGAYFKFSSVRSNPSWSKGHEDHCRAFLNSLNLYINDPIAAQWRHCDKVGPHEDFYHFKANPIDACLTMYDISLSVHRDGMAYLAGLGAVVPALYVYRLLQITPNTAQVHWPDLEEFLRLHNEDFIFIGGQPANLQECFKKLQIFHGAKASSWAKDARPGVVKRSLKQRCMMVKSSAHMALTFLKAMGTSGLAVDYSVDMIEKVFHCLRSIPNTSQDDQAEEAPSKPLRNRKQSSSENSDKYITAMELLTKMRNQMMTEEPDLIFNYYGLSLHCAAFLEELIEPGCRVVEQYTPHVSIPSSGYRPLVVLIYALAAVVESETLSQSLRMRGSLTDTEYLRRAAKIMAKHAKDNGNKACKELRAFSRKAKLGGVESSKE